MFIENNLGLIGSGIILCLVTLFGWRREVCSSNNYLMKIKLKYLQYNVTQYIQNVLLLDIFTGLVCTSVGNSWCKVGCITQS